MYADFETRLAEAVAVGRIAGAVALVLDRDGIVYETAAGCRGVADSAAMDSATVFWIASMTKALVSVAALQLVERGMLSLDGDLSELLPELQALQVLAGEDAAGQPILRPAKGVVTLRRLLSHTSGFGYGWLAPQIEAWAQAVGAPSAASGLRAARRQPLLFDPGQGWAYGIGLDWAGFAVEAASGLRLDAYLAENLFGPLGMTDTAFALSPQQVARKAGMHARGLDGALVPITYDLPPDPEALSGGGGLHGTGRDYSCFLQMILNGGEVDGVRVLSREMTAALGEVQTGDLRAGAWKTAAPGLSRDLDLFPQMRTGWGLATLINPQAVPGGRGAGSLAWAGLANTYFWADPSAGKAGVLLTQVLPFGDPLVLELFAALERGAYALA